MNNASRIKKNQNLNNTVSTNNFNSSKLQQQNMNKTVQSTSFQKQFDSTTHVRERYIPKYDAQRDKYLDYYMQSEGRINHLKQLGIYDQMSQQQKTLQVINAPLSQQFEYNKKVGRTMVGNQSQPSLRLRCKIAKNKYLVQENPFEQQQIQEKYNSRSQTAQIGFSPRSQLGFSKPHTANQDSSINYQYNSIGIKQLTTKQMNENFFQLEQEQSIPNSRYQNSRSQKLKNDKSALITNNSQGWFQKDVSYQKSQINFHKNDNSKVIKNKKSPSSRYLEQTSHAQLKNVYLDQKLSQKFSSSGLAMNKPAPYGKYIRHHESQHQKSIQEESEKLSCKRKQIESEHMVSMNKITGVKNQNYDSLTNNNNSNENNNYQNINNKKKQQEIKQLERIRQQDNYKQYPSQQLKDQKFEPYKQQSQKYEPMFKPKNTNKNTNNISQSKNNNNSQINNNNKQDNKAQDDKEIQIKVQDQNQNQKQQNQDQNQQQPDQIKEEEIKDLKPVGEKDFKDFLMKTQEKLNTQTSREGSVSKR